MALIKCSECGKKISDKSTTCINCGCPVKEIKKQEKKEEERIKKENKPKKDHKKLIIIIISLCILIPIIIIIISKIYKNYQEKQNIEKCKQYVMRLQSYIDSKDTEGFDDNWGKDISFYTDDTCNTFKCNCPKSWDLFLENKINKSDKYLEQGLVSSAYDSLGSNYISDYKILKDYYNNHNIFKLISSKQKEEITGIYHSFGSWKWSHTVGGSFKFNKRLVRYGSSYLNLQFDNYSDKVLISGHLLPNKHKNWNSENNISVNWYNYKILENKIYLKLENESDNKYDALFEIVTLNDTTLSLKLLQDMEDVNAGQIYNFNYERS